MMTKKKSFALLESIPSVSLKKPDRQRLQSTTNHYSRHRLSQPNHLCLPRTPLKMPLLQPLLELPESPDVPMTG